jgi:uncharacterized damage-inducible protein DinB
MTRTDEIRQAWEYNRWANARMIEAASALSAEQFRQDMGSSFPSVRDTLIHVLSAEWVWLSRLQGVSPASIPEAWEQLLLEGISREWARVDQSMRDHIAGLQDTALDQPLSYRDTAGRPYVSTAAQILRHVVNHSSYHRGQVTTMLRQLGAAAPATDLILYYRTHEPDPS